MILMLEAISEVRCKLLQALQQQIQRTSMKQARGFMFSHVFFSLENPSVTRLLEARLLKTGLFAPVEFLVRSLSRHSQGAPGARLRLFLWV